MLGIRRRLYSKYSKLFKLRIKRSHQKEQFNGTSLERRWLFQHASFAAFIEKASIETVDEFVPKTRKAGAAVSEFRDKVDPAIITQFLMTLLETNGTAVYPPLLRKRIKDDVCWDDAELPWRRSPFWLIFRVCTQRILYLRLGAERGRIQYKLLMILVLVRLLEDCLDRINLEDSNFLKTKICRRFAKLDFELANSPQTVRDAYTGLSEYLTGLPKAYRHGHKSL